MRLGVLLVALLMTAPAHADDATWLAGLEAWKKQRLESIVGEEGWITLVGRLWLHPGENHLGSDPKSELTLPADRAPAHVGSIFVEGGRLRIVVAPGVDDRDDKPTVLTLGSLTMRVIKRLDRLALRVKDRAHPARKTFAGLHYYPADRSLRVQAHLEPAPAGTTTPIVNVLGQTEQMVMPGRLHFALGGVEYTLDAVREPGEDRLFILLRDQTAGHGTYPSGRFVYTALPDDRGNVELDFNRAYNPPCAFTDFATCPLPPLQNRLPRAIEAGERYDGHH